MSITLLSLICGIHNRGDGEPPLPLLEWFSPRTLFDSPLFTQNSTQMVFPREEFLHSQSALPHQSTLHHLFYYPQSTYQCPMLFESYNPLFVYSLSPLLEYNLMRSGTIYAFLIVGTIALRMGTGISSLFDTCLSPNSQRLLWASPRDSGR